MTDGRNDFQARIARIEANRAETYHERPSEDELSRAEMEAHIEELKLRSPGAPRRSLLSRFSFPRLRRLRPVLLVMAISYGAVSFSNGMLRGGQDSAGPLTGITFQSAWSKDSGRKRGALPTISGGGFEMPSLTGGGMTGVHAMAFDKAGVTATVEDALADFHKSAAKLKR